MPAKWSYPRETTSRLADLVRDVQNPPTSLRERLADLVRDVLAQHVPREVRLHRVLHRPIRQRTSCGKRLFSGLAAHGGHRARHLQRFGQEGAHDRGDVVLVSSARQYGDPRWVV